MYPDAFTIERLANELDIWLKNSTLETVYSTSKTELYFAFDLNKGFKIQFFKGQAFFQFPNRDQFPEKNKLKQFSTLHDQKVLSINSHPYSRSFDIEFTNGHKLVFKLYGSSANVISYESGTVNMFCIDYPKDLQIPIEHYTNPNLSSKQTFNSLIDFVKSNPKNEALSYLETEILSKNYDLPLAIECFKTQFLSQSIYILKTNDNAYGLSCFPSAQSMAEFPKICEAFDDFTRLYISSESFNSKKTSHIDQLQRDIEHQHKTVENIEKRITTLNQWSKTKELGDLLMTNLHLLKLGDSVIEVPEYLDSEPETKKSISLNPLLSPHQNASYYYQLAKNQAKELLHKQSELIKAKDKLKVIADTLSKWQLTENAKQLRVLDTKDKADATKKSISLPYRRYIINGFTALVGKNAKSNDELLSKHAVKNDLWLHAKDVSGSHVILKNHTGNPIPAFIIEEAASLAAWHSKAKNNSLAAVVYTFKKYVRKQKGFLPGQVIVERETGLLVKPKAFTSN